MTTLTWRGGLHFEALPPSGSPLHMDAYPDSGGEGHGPTPLEAFLSALAACSAMDVISIMQKKQQRVTSYRVEIDGVRGPEGVFPRPYASITVRHIVSGENIDMAALQRSVQLSEEKYCAVLATLRESPAVHAECVVE
ncbi:MAG: OsmC family protein [Chthonomonas sp.]|nr:OsmC family protein [Chthonomonas sp.]